MKHCDSKCKRCKWYKFEQSDGELIFFKPGGNSVEGVNSVKGVNSAFFLLIMVERRVSLLCLKGLKGVNGVNSIIWMSEDH